MANCTISIGARISYRLRLYVMLAHIAIWLGIISEDDAIGLVDRWVKETWAMRYIIVTKLATASDLVPTDDGIPVRLRHQAKGQDDEQ